MLCKNESHLVHLDSISHIHPQTSVLLPQSSENAPNAFAAKREDKQIDLYRCGLAATMSRVKLHPGIVAAPLFRIVLVLDRMVQCRSKAHATGAFYLRPGTALVILGLT